MAKTASCITTWRGCLKNSTVHASLLGMYHSATIQLLFFFDCAITSNFHILNPDMRQNCKVPLVCTHTHTLNQITLNWIRVDEHTRFKAIPIMELGRWSSYRKGEKSENLSVDLMTKPGENCLHSPREKLAWSNTEAVRPDKSWGLKKTGRNERNVRCM